MRARIPLRERAASYGFPVFATRSDDSDKHTADGKGKGATLTNSKPITDGIHPMPVTAAVSRVGVVLVAQMAMVNLVVETSILWILPLFETLPFAFLESLLDAAVSTGLSSAVAYRFIILPIRRELSSTTAELNNARQESERLSRIDPLTQIPNRRHFFEQAERQWSQSCRFNSSLACIMIDVDHFKQFNDLHGHAVGDEVLKGVARTLDGSCRPGDLICRYGGEEFCLVLAATDLAGAFGVAERIRRAVCDQPISLGSDCFHVSISLGVAGKVDSMSGFDELVSRADAALRAAKKQGRNRTVIAQENDAVECNNRFVTGAELES